MKIPHYIIGGFLLFHHHNFASLGREHRLYVLEAKSRQAVSMFNHDRLCRRIAQQPQQALAVPFMPEPTSFTASVTHIFFATAYSVRRDNWR